MNILKFYTGTMSWVIWSKRLLLKGLEQDHRGMANIAKIDLNPGRIMGDKKAAISDTTIVKE